VKKLQRDILLWVHWQLAFWSQASSGLAWYMKATLEMWWSQCENLTTQPHHYRTFFYSSRFI